MPEKTATRYLIGTEIACIYSQGSRGRRIHTLVFAPNLETAAKINDTLRLRGFNVSSDGRPILGLSCVDLAQMLFSISEDIIIIPAHIWTPWFGMLGSKSGFDSLRETYGKYAEKITAIETGLSSDPAMNWQISELENRAIVSFSDAHSVEKLGRELTVFTSKDKEIFTYQDFKLALRGVGQWYIDYTIEFYPEEGKYHVDGHRDCHVWQLPEQTRKKGRQCRVCGKTLTLGVLGRVDRLANQQITVGKKTNDKGVVFYSNQTSQRPPYVMLVPLLEIIAESLGKGSKTKGVVALYDKLISHFGSEITILMETDDQDIAKVAGSKVGEAIKKVRAGKIAIRPGYDGVFGKVKIWADKKEDEIADENDQMTLF